jgi:transcriptional regulator with XRE-family HTH domain
MLTELGIYTSALTQLESKNSFPAGDRVAKMALYLDVSVDYLLGMSVPAKEPGQAALEAYLAMTEEERKAFIQEMSALVTDAETISENERSNGADCFKDSDYNKLHAQLNVITDDLSDSINVLRSRQNALSETIDALVPVPEPSKSLIVQFLDLPSQQQKSFVLEAIVRMERWRR